MRSLILTCAVLLAFSSTGLAVDIAISTQAGWYSQAAADREMQEVVDAVTTVSVERFTASEQDALADWVAAHTGDGVPDLLILNGQFPATIYTPGNTQADDSLAELFLDDGNTIINTGDYMFYVVGGAGTNAEGGLQTMMDIAGITMWDDDTAVVVTPEGEEYTPSLQDFASDRPFHLDELEGDWSAELILAQNAAGTRADPVIVVNEATGGRLGIFYQTSGQDNDPRGEVISEWINNWYLPNLGGENPLARSPSPKDESMVGQTSVQVSWKPGDFAALHDVYFGEDYEQVLAATPDDANLYIGRQALTEVLIGGAGGAAPDGLTPGTTYYWRVDEVNDVEPNSPWKGDVWSFWVQPVVAYNPSPADGTPYVSLDPELTWEAGMNTLFHTVFIAQSLEDLDSAAGIPAADPMFRPGPLEIGTTYYWRVDEFTYPANETHTGDAWSFTTVPEISIDDPDLAGWWTLDEGVGTTAVDWSGHGHHGELMGDPQWTDGYHGGALELDGTGDYVMVGEVGISGAAPRTIAGWAKASRTNITAWTDVFGFTGPSGAGGHFDIEAVGDTASTNLGWYGLHVYGWERNIIPIDLEWHHLAATYDGTTASWYADGALIASEEATVDTPDNVHIGKRQDNGNFFPGLVDDVRVYSTVLTEDEIAEAMRGNPLLAGNPSPSPGAVLDIRDATALSWTAGGTAASHDVYFGTDRAAVAAAGTDAPEFQGNQSGTSLSLAGLVELGGGDYYWRVDEVESDGTVHTGYTWRFTVADHLIVEDFESYTDDMDAEEAVFQTWIDGFGDDSNGSVVGYIDSQNGTFNETRSAYVHGGSQAMPFEYDNTDAAYSEAYREFAPAQDWTVEGVDTLMLHVLGQTDNAPGRLYVVLEDSAGNDAVVAHDDETVVTSRRWTEWPVPLTAFAGVNPARIQKVTIGVGDRDNPTAGGAGLLFVDDVWVTKSDTAE